MDDFPPLPHGVNAMDGQSLLDWVEELGITVQFEIVDGYPTLPLKLAEHSLIPPEIRIWRYLPWEPWLQDVCERHLLFIAPWYLIYVARHLYSYLESQGLYELRTPWYRLDLKWRWRTLESRSDDFTTQVLGLIRPPHRLDRILSETFTVGERGMSSDSP